MTTEMQMVERKEPEVELSERLTQLVAAAEARQVTSLRMRVQPAVLNQETKLYVSLPGVSWLFDVAGREQVLDVKESMDLFFRAMARIGGPGEMKDYMREVLAAIEAEKDAAQGEGGQG